MALSRWSPVREFDRLFSDFFGSPIVEYSGEPRSWYLPLDIVDTGDAYEVKAAVPGFNPEDVEVTVTNGVLHIEAQRKQESETKGGTYLRRELRYGSYERSVQLPTGINEGDIKASFENGMLTVEIPKTPAPQPKKIPVNAKSEPKLVGVKSEK